MATIYFLRQLFKIKGEKNRQFHKVREIFPPKTIPQPVNICGKLNGNSKISLDVRDSMFFNEFL